MTGSTSKHTNERTPRAYDSKSAFKTMHGGSSAMPTDNRSCPYSQSAAYNSECYVDRPATPPYDTHKQLQSDMEDEKWKTRTARQQF